MYEQLSSRGLSGCLGVLIGQRRDVAYLVVVRPGWSLVDLADLAPRSVWSQDAVSLLVLFTLFATSEESPHERQVRLAREAADAFALWRTRHGDQVEYLTAQFAASHSSWRVLDELSPFLLAFFLVAALGLLTLACLYWLARPKVPPKRA